MKTLEEEKQHLRENWIKGTHCPCCDQFVKRYSRLFDSGLARFMIGLYKLSGGHFKPFDKDEIRAAVGIKRLQATNYGILKHWGVAEVLENENTKIRTSGQWVILPKGVQFVKKELQIQRYCFTFNNVCYGFSEDLLTIDEALGEHFNYSALMSM